MFTLVPCSPHTTLPSAPTCPGHRASKAMGSFLPVVRSREGNVSPFAVGKRQLSQRGGKSPVGRKVPAAGGKVPAAAVAADDAEQATLKGKESCSSGCIAENGGTQLAPSCADWEK